MYFFVKENCKNVFILQLKVYFRSSDLNAYFYVNTKTKSVLFKTICVKVSIGFVHQSDILRIVKLNVCEKKL